MRLSVTKNTFSKVTNSIMSPVCTGIRRMGGILRSSETVRNLGVTIDQQMTFDAHAPARDLVFISFVAFDRSDGSSMTGHCDYWYTHLSRHAWITVMHCWLTAACLFANGSNESRTVLRVWSAPNQLLAMPHHCWFGEIGRAHV